MEILNSKIYEKQGTTPLLIFHGLFGMLDNFAGLGAKFAQTNEVHLMDLRNHGDSFHSDVMECDTMAEDIANYIKHYNLGKVILLGHSLGGRAVMQCALKFPELVEKLIVVDTAPKTYEPHHDTIFDALLSVDFSKIQDRKEVEEVLKQKIEDPGVYMFLMKSVYKKENESYAYKFNLPAIVKAYPNMISNDYTGQYEGDTLFIAGGNSDYIQSKDHLSIVRLFPKAKIEYIQGASHWVHAEKPMEFFNLVSDFIKQ